MALTGQRYTSKNAQFPSLNIPSFNYVAPKLKPNSTKNWWELDW